jgi:hypothetical protein
MAKKIKKKCEWCNNEFEVSDNIRGRRFCSMQ